MYMKDHHILHSYVDRLPLDVMTVGGQTRPKAILQIAHGMCGYKEKFLPMMEYMADYGILCVAHDHRGHGRSVWTEDDLGHMYGQSYTTLISDMRQVQDYARRTFADYAVPYYMVGHSMGSLAVRTYLKKFDSHVDGVFLCGTPAWNHLAPAAYLFTGLMTAVGLGRLRAASSQRTLSEAYNRRFAVEGDMAWICSDPVARAQYLETASSRTVFTMNSSNVLMGLMREAYSKKGWKVSNPSIPVVFLSGSEDSCLGDPSELGMSVSLMNRLGYRDVRQKIYPAMRHDILCEIGKEQVWNDILGVICRP